MKLKLIENEKSEEEERENAQMGRRKKEKCDKRGGFVRGENVKANVEKNNERIDKWGCTVLQQREKMERDFGVLH